MCQTNNFVTRSILSINWRQKINKFFPNSFQTELVKKNWTINTMVATETESVWQLPFWGFTFGSYFKFSTEFLSKASTDVLVRNNATGNT